jgi:cytosine/uracil/thiamine/allantoin permease
LTSAAAVLLALIGAYRSWNASNIEGAQTVPAAEAAKRVSVRFLNQLGALMGLTFAFALTLQTAASLIVSPCER